MDEKDKLAILRYRCRYGNLCRGRKKIIDQLILVKKEEGKPQKATSN